MKSCYQLVLLLMLSTYVSMAQNPVLRNYAVEDGLPSSHVYYTMEDSKGFIWVCTDMGVSRFDGYNFKTFTVEDGLPNNDVWRIQEDEKGRMWLSTFNELVYIEQDKVVKLPILETLEVPVRIVNSYIDDHQNHLVMTDRLLKCDV